MGTLSLHPPPTLRYKGGGRALLIRPARVSDAAVLVDAIVESQAALRAFMPWAHDGNTVPMQEERLAKAEEDHRTGGDVVYHLYDGTHERFLGCMGLHHRSLNRKALEVGYWLRTGEAGQGWTTLAVQCLAVLTFDYLDYDRLQCAYNESNAGSRRVNEKVGFHSEGLHRYFEEQPTDEMIQNGCKMTAFTVSTALTRHDPPNLDWYEPIRAGLSVWDTDGNLCRLD